MRTIKQIPFKIGLLLFILLQIFAYSLDIKGLKILAFYNDGLEMQISIMAIVIPILVESIIYFTSKHKNQ